MLRVLLAAFVAFAATGQQPRALARPDVEFKVFQFPPNMIPRIDGNIDDWAIVPDDYVVGTDQLADYSGRRPLGQKADPKSLDVKVRVGWVKGMNKLYFCYEAYDNYWDMYYRRGDIFEVLVDADLSGGNVIQGPYYKGIDNYFNYQGVYGQNYHIFTPPGEGRDWAFVWGCQPWINDLPWANHAYNYNFKEGEGGKLILEFMITPFDYAPYDGPARAVESKLVENTIIGLTWTIIDYDAGRDHNNLNDDDGFYSISHHKQPYMDASACCAFRLMPLLPELKEPIHAEWSFKVIDMDRRLVAFKDESYGDITSWFWEFDDGTTSTEQHPIHTYTMAGEFVVTLTVKGPAGTAKRIKVRDVAVK